MNKYFRATISILWIISCPVLVKAQSCSGCTITINEVNSQNYTLNVGEQLCIGPNGTVLGNIVLNGGTICNQGVLIPSSIQCLNGKIYNYGNITYSGTLTLSNTCSIENYSVIDLSGNILVDVNASYLSSETGASLRTNMPDLTQIQAQYDNYTVSALTDELNCDAVANATAYQYEVTDVFSNSSVNYTSTGTSTIFKLSFVYTTFNNGRSYKIKVRANVAGVWGAYGISRTVNTPLLPTALLGSQCNSTLPYATFLKGANNTQSPDNYFYRFEFSNLQNFSDFDVNNPDMSQTINRKDSLQLSAVPGLVPGNLYYVRIIAFDSTNSRQADPGSVCSVSIINSPLNLVLSSSSASVCNGEKISLQVSGADSYTWVDKTGNFISTLAQLEVSPEISTTYYVIGKTGNLEKLDSLSIIVKDTPVLTVTTEELIVCGGANASLNAQGQGTFKWFTTDENNVLSSTSNYNYTPTQTEVVTVKLTGTNACSAVKTIKVNSVNFALIVPAQIEQVIGTKQQILVTSEAEQYQWSPSTFLNYDNVKSPVCAATNNLTYTITATKEGCSKTAQVSIQTVRKKSLFFTYSYPGLSVNFLSDNLPNTSYSWDFGDNTALGTGYNPTHVYTAEGNYRVKLSINEAGTIRKYDTEVLVRSTIE